MKSHLLLAAAAMATLAFDSGAQSQRPYTVEDLLQLEDIGAAVFSPDGERLYFEHHTRFDRQPEHSRQWVSGKLRSRLMVADTGGSDPARQAVPQQDGHGYSLAGLSPDGRRLAVVRTGPEAVEFGLAATNGGQVHYFDFAPERFGLGATTWLADGRLLTRSTPDERLPYAAAMHNEDREALAAAWRKRNQGREATSVAIGSGRFAGPRSESTAMLWVDGASQDYGRFIDGPVDGIVASPDGASLLYASAVSMDLSGVERLEHGANSGGLEHRLLLRRSNGEGDAVDVCPRCDVLTGSVTWRPDGRMFAFYARQPGQDWRNGRFHVYDLAAAQARTVDLGDLEPHIGRANGISMQVRLSWLGERLAVLARAPIEGHVAPDARADWYLQEGTAWRSLTAAFEGETPDLVAMGDDALILVHDGDVWSVDATAARCNLTERVDDALVRWDPDPLRAGRGNGNDVEPVRTVTVQTRRSGEEQPLRLWFVDLQGGGVERIDATSPRAEVVAVSVDARKVAFLDKPGGEGRLTVVGADGGVRPIMEINRHLREVAAGRPVRIDHEGPKGDARHSWLLLPPGHQAGSRLPTIVNVYPGSVGREFWRKWQPDALNALNDHVLAGQGYAVLYPSLPQDYTQVPRDPLEGLVESVFAAVDAAIEAGYVDGERLAVQGQSYGGYATAALVGLTHRFKSAVAQAGPYDLISLYGTFDPRDTMRYAEGGLSLFGASLLETSQGGMGAPPWDDPERYFRNSPLMHVENVQTPIMLLHGDRDYVPVQQAEELFTALTRLGKDAVFVRYYGEDHVYESPANIRDMWRRIIAWYGETLGPPVPAAR